jgi:hypothetical protein
MNRTTSEADGWTVTDSYGTVSDWIQSPYRLVDAGLSARYGGMECLSIR